MNRGMVGRRPTSGMIGRCCWAELDAALGTCASDGRQGLLVAIRDGHPRNAAQLVPQWLLVPRRIRPHLVEPEPTLLDFVHNADPRHCVLVPAFLLDTDQR